ncbi:MAG: hypothetical protein R3Y32_00070 [Bacillota bacterium]
MNVVEFIFENNRFDKVWESGSVSEIARIVDDNIMYQKRDVFLQSSWMGRGCYKKVGEDYLFLKGVGPSAGSEEFRLVMNDFWNKRSIVKKGGCVRIFVEDFSILVEYFYDNKYKIELFDPRPEGYSIFGAVYREAIFSDYVYNKGGIVPKPISVYKGELKYTWGNHNKQAMGDFVRSQFITLQSLDGRIEINLSKIFYDDNKVGLLARLLKSEIRLQELVKEYIDNKDSFGDICYNLDVIAKKKGYSNLLSHFESAMIKNLILLVELGVIHSNLQTHFQNFTLAGEICDWDAAIIYSNGSAEQEVIDIFHKADSLYDADILKYYNLDKLLCKNYSCAAVQQMYAIINACLYLRKLYSSYCNVEYTLKKYRKDMDELVGKIFFNKGELFQNEIKGIISGFKKSELQYHIVSKRSILGWINPHRPEDYSQYVCDENDENLLKEDVAVFVDYLRVGVDSYD